MRAFQVSQFGKASKMQINEVAASQPASGQIAIRVSAAGVNPADWYVINGMFQLPPALPVTPGFEAAGEIVAVGEGVTEFAVGDRVLAVLPFLSDGTATFGAFAEQAVVPVANVVAIPDEMEFEIAAAIPVMYGTAHVALTYRGHLQAEETLLVTGASGTTGTAAVQIGKQIGATVIATASGTEKIERVKQLGADYVIDYRQEEVTLRLKEITAGKGVDVVFETVGGSLFDAILPMIASEGRMLPIGAASGTVPEVSIFSVLTGNFSIIGTDFANYTLNRTDIVTQSLADVISWNKPGFFEAINLKKLPIEEAAEAIDAAYKGAGARLVLTL